MPRYVGKVTETNGWLRYPGVANFPTEEEAEKSDTGYRWRSAIHCHQGTA